ncbi:chemosensory protein [Asbolus verrucosus]|uniref:Chemosensory protein n=1 Tax=Asbolus verrucosus TaxID=1661398 RepID=A0A482VMA9_ASBVE|nr:chemosensory protein [Asbolus verrucosus]
MSRIFLLVIFSTFALVSVRTAENKYTTKYDSINLEDVVKNERLLKNYMNCLLEKGRCTPDGFELRKNIPDAIATDCSKCSEKQKEGANFIMKYLIDHEPEYWKSLEVKYDPDGTYKRKYLESKENEKEFVTGKNLHRSLRSPQYTTKYDNIDVDSILHSKRLLLSYINCFLEKGPCSPEGRDLKNILPDALATDCAKCSEVQKKQAGKVLYFILLNHRNEWNQLIDKYDPTGIYRKKYEIDEDYDYSELDAARK